MGIRKKTRYQRRFLKKQKEKGFRQVSCFLSEETYNNLCKLKEVFSLTLQGWINYNVKMDMARYEDEIAAYEKKKLEQEQEKE